MINGKLAKNIWNYDKKITKKLKDMNYIVIRFLESKIKNNIGKCLKKIGEIIK
jgi:very-short-patch-repair endonuclease